MWSMSHQLSRPALQQLISVEGVKQNYDFDTLWNMKHWHKTKTTKKLKKKIFLFWLY